jgi:hypothetical protein
MEPCCSDTLGMPVPCQHRQPADPSGLREALVVAMENEGVVTWGDEGHRARFLAATPTEERLDAEPSRLDEVGDDRNPYIERTRERVAWEEGWQAYHAALASTEGERPLPRPPRTYPCPSCGEVGDHSTECTEGERTDG